LPLVHCVTFSALQRTHVSVYAVSIVFADNPQLRGAVQLLERLTLNG
jgi:hypothetical protein